MQQFIKQNLLYAFLRSSHPIHEYRRPEWKFRPPGIVLLRAVFLRRGSLRLTLRLVSVRGSVCGSGVAVRSVVGSVRWISVRWISVCWLSIRWYSRRGRWCSRRGRWLSRRSRCRSRWCRSSRCSRSGCRSSCRRRICAGIAGSAKCNHRNSHVNFTIQSGRL